MKHDITLISPATYQRKRRPGAILSGPEGPIKEHFVCLLTVWMPGNATIHVVINQHNLETQMDLQPSKDSERYTPHLDHRFVTHQTTPQTGTRTVQPPVIITFFLSSPSQRTYMFAEFVHETTKQHAAHPAARVGCRQHPPYGVCNHRCLSPVRANAVRWALVCSAIHGGIYHVLRGDHGLRAGGPSDG